MAGSRIFLKKGERGVCRTITFCVVLTLLLCAAGCISEHSSVNASQNMPAAISCPPAGSQSPYITINRVSPHYVGDVFDINGTTNLGVDAKIILDLREPEYLGKAPSSEPVTSTPVAYDQSGTNGYVQIKEGTCGRNSWSFIVNSTGYHNQKYNVNIKDESNRSTNNWTQFFIYEKEAAPASCPVSANHTQYIIINHIGPHTVGDVFEINGTTNLGPDKKMMVEVREETHLGIGPNDNKAPYYVLSQSKDYARIQDTDCQDKFWSYPVNMTGFHGGKQYWVTAFVEQRTYPPDVINYSIFYTSRLE